MGLFKETDSTGTIAIKAAKIAFLVGFFCFFAFSNNVFDKPPARVYGYNSERYGVQGYVYETPSEYGTIEAIAAFTGVFLVLFFIYENKKYIRK